MNYFPLKLAQGIAFINREIEKNQVLKCINDMTPLLIMSPRRYGKTSLVLHVLTQNHLLYSHVDLYMELTSADIVKAILRGIGQLLGKLEPTPKRLLKLATDFFSSFQIGAVLKKGGFEIQFEFALKQKKAADIILMALEKLEALAKSRKQKLVLFLDEFQVLGEVASDSAIEAAIRHAAQASEYVEYIFSGSNRHLLAQIFSDKKRPLYKLCHSIKLQRIEKEHYEKYFQNIAHHIWKKEIEIVAIDHILFLTQRHPYYVNRLCWLLSLEKEVTEKTVNTCWDNYVQGNRSIIESDLVHLTLNQRLLLLSIVRNKPTKTLHSKEHQETLSIPPGSISRAEKALLEKDYLYIDDEGFYRILDPLMLSVLTTD